MSVISIILVGVTTFATGWITAIHAEEQVQVEVRHYTHGGCVANGRRFLPQAADRGRKARFWLPRQREACLDAVSRLRYGCGLATRFSATNPDGHPWQPGEKVTECLNVFREEVSQCVAHYDGEKVKCQANKESPNCRYARRLFSQYKSACDAGDANVCRVLGQAEEHVKRACR